MEEGDCTHDINELYVYRIVVKFYNLQFNWLQILKALWADGSSIGQALENLLSSVISGGKHRKFALTRAQTKNNGWL